MAKKNPKKQKTPPPATIKKTQKTKHKANKQQNPKDKEGSKQNIQTHRYGEQMGGFQRRGAGGG